MSLESNNKMFLLFFIYRSLQTSKMATGGPGRAVPHLYEEDDVLDERLLNQISKWIMYHRLPSLARHLGISDAEISRIMIHYSTPRGTVLPGLQFSLASLLYRFLSNQY